MAFKIEAPYKFNHVPIYRTLDEDGLLELAKTLLILHS
jgi:hypothetical protein